jgi:DNA-binding NarL/FixJ family response regulator
VVEDYEPFRRFICSMLGKRSELLVVGEISDGLEAVQKAEELQPDLIVLDIGLPSLNGIEAARRIRRLSPASRILFLSQESSADVVHEVLALGAMGYVVKACAGSELLAAVGAVLEEGQFVSSGLSSPLTSAPDSKAIKAEITHSHEVGFYSDDGALVIGFTQFIEAALRAGNAVIVVATESHQRRILLSLQEREVNIADFIQQNSYLPLDVDETLSTFMVNGLPDRTRFLKVARDLMAEAARSKGTFRRVSACGECAPSLWAQGYADAAIEVEHLWGEIAETYNVNILCGYILSRLQRERENHIYERICAEHSVVHSP